MSAKYGLRGKGLGNLQTNLPFSTDVVYSLGGRAIIEDRGAKLMMLQTDRFAIEAGLRLAEAKFGSIIILSGPKEFQERAALVAADAGVKVTFQNKKLEKIREDRAAHLASERARRTAHRELGREFVAAQRPDLPTPESGQTKSGVKPVQERTASLPEPGKNPDRER